MKYKGQLITHIKYKAFLDLSIFLLVFFFNSSNIQAQTPTVNKINIVFINPSSEENPYWDFISKTMKKAARDFGMNLQIIKANRHRIHNAEPLLKTLEAMDKPDYLIYIYQEKLGVKLLEFAEKNKIKSFILNTSISDKDKVKVGKPTEIYKYWIGHSYPNLVDIAARLSQETYNLAKRNVLIKKDKKIYSVVLSASRDTDIANQWNNGVKLTSNNIDDYQIKQIVYSDFDDKKGYEQTKKLLIRYPEVSVIMSVDENVALSAIKAAEELGRKPGKDIFIASAVTQPQALDMVENKNLTASYALSIWSGVYSMVYLYDYHNGRITDIKALEYSYSNNSITPDEISTYRKIMLDNLWQHIDYRYFSHTYSLDSNEYDFSAYAFERALQTSRINNQ